MSTIINDFLYLDSLSNACTPEILNKLKITHLINLNLTKIILDQSFEILDLPLNDSLQENIHKYFQQTNEIIENIINNRMGDVLSFVNMEDQDQLQFVIVYLIEHHGHSLSSAYSNVLLIRPSISPNINYLKQLDQYSSQSE